MMEYAYYSVISPEGCAAILWKDGERSPEAADALRLPAPDLQGLGLIDGIIPEPPGGAHRAPQVAMATVRQTILDELARLEAIPIERLLSLRREKYRRIGELPGRFPRLD